MYMFTLRILLLIVALVGSIEIVQSKIEDVNLVTNFTENIAKTQQAIIFGCARKDLLSITAALLQWNQATQAVHMSTNYTLTSILTRKNHARTAVIVDCACPHVEGLLEQVSTHHYFNKTYQWLLWDTANAGVMTILPKSLNYLGPNAQVTLVNGTASDGEYFLWDLHSKGLHLNSPLEIKLIAMWKNALGDDNGGYFVEYINIFEQQGIRQRDQFNNLMLRGAIVIDRDNITTNEQIIDILSLNSKTDGVATFIRYHYALLTIVAERLNFSIHFRNSRGWAGRLGNTTFRLGLLGVVKRDEADVAASPSLNRINRFADFDTIHQSWKFETAFLYRFTPDLDSHGKSGNFLAPFENLVWYYAIAILFIVNFIWRLVECLKIRYRLKMQTWQNQTDGESAAVTLNDKCERGDRDNNATPINVNDNDDETTLTAISLKTFGAVCQQGMEQVPNGLSTRTIIITMFLYSLIMYNFYTSSVVGGLLSSTAQGPETVADVLASPLKVAFEDIGYYKVMFRETKSPIYQKLYRTKVLPPRDPTQLPAYTHVEDAIPFLKKGGYAFHCEVIDAYPLIGKLFDADDICDLRKVPGMIEKETINWIVTKRSQYTELLRIVSDKITEVGLVKRTLDLMQTKKPPCQALYRVFPISLPGVLSAFFMLIGGYIGALIALMVELRFKKYTQLQKQKIQNIYLK